MKKLTAIFILFISVTVCVAQKKVANTSNSPYGTSNIYSASVVTSGLNVGLTIDANTRWIEYHNVLPNRPLENYVFLNGTKKIGLIAYIPKGDIKNYRYNIIQDNSIYLASNAMPKGASKGLIPNRIEINLGAFDIENKKLQIETYKVSERNKVSTTTIYNKEFKPAIVLITTLGISNTDGSRSGVMMENMKDGFKFKHDIKGTHKRIVNSIVVAIKQTDLIFIYNVYVKNMSTGKNIPVSNNWIYDFFRDKSDSAVPYIRIDASFFEDPGDYEISIIPKLPSGFQNKSFPGKTTTIHFTVLKSAVVYTQRSIIIIVLSLILIAALVIYYYPKNRLM